MSKENNISKEPKDNMSKKYSAKQKIKNPSKQQNQEITKNKELDELNAKKCNQINNNYIDSIKKEFYQPPLTGLINVGATFYMNAVLQCFSHIEGLVNFFKYNKYVDDVIERYKGRNCLTKSFKILIENLWPTYGNKYINKNLFSKNIYNSYFIPKEFKETISKMNPLFEGVQANDAKDLVNFIVMTLHKELNKVGRLNFNDISDNGIDQSNQDLVFKNFATKFIKENRSIISDLFYEFSHNVTRCSKCLIDKHNFEAYFFLIFPLEEVRKYKLQLILNQNNLNMNQMSQQNLKKIKLLQNNQVDIFDCFEYNQKPVFFIGENAMYCNTCKESFPTTYTTYLYIAPQILLIILNRGIGIQYKVKLEFNTELNLSNFIQARPNNENIIYDLIGVVTHIGESGPSGHFIATCKSPIDNLWYQYNDDLVFKIDNFTNQILNYAMPYILFYQKKS